MEYREMGGMRKNGEETWPQISTVQVTPILRMKFVEQDHHPLVRIPLPLIVIQDTRKIIAIVIRRKIYM